MCFLALALIIWTCSCSSPTGVNAIPFYVNGFPLDSNYRALDQCFPDANREGRNNQTGAKNVVESFTLKFILNGKCDKGFLLCYPGRMDGYSANINRGLGTGTPFQVPNVDNLVTIKCKRHLQCGDSCPFQGVLHGLRVSSKPGPGPQQLRLQLSISNRTYNLGIGITEFDLVFGNSDNLLTVAKDAKGNRISSTFGDDLLRDAFLERIGRGANAADYAGLWLLGLDLLPLYHDRVTLLHNKRECGCEMHVWFLHPNDQFDFNRTLLTEPINCGLDKYENDLNRTFALSPPFGSGQTLNLRFRFRKEDNLWVKIKLLNNTNNVAIEINSTVVTVHSRSNSTESNSRENLPKDMLISAEKYAHVQIIARQYFYEIFLNGILSAKHFLWPDNWWMHDELEEFTSVTIGGSLLHRDFIEQPEVIKTLNPLRYYTNHVERLSRPLIDGENIVIRGQLSDNAQVVEFNIFHDIPEYSDYLGAVVLNLKISKFDGQPNLLEGRLTVRDPYTQTNINVTSKGRNTEVMLKHGMAFEIRITLMGRWTASNKVFVQLFTKERGPNTWEISPFDVDDLSITRFQIVGDLATFIQPYYEQNILFPRDAKLKKLYPMLSVGDFIQINGKMKEKATQLKIQLLHDSTDVRVYEGDVVLELKFDIAEKSTHFEARPNFRNIRLKNGSEVCELSAFEEEVDLDKLPDEIRSRHTEKEFCRVHAGETFSVLIHVAKEEFQIHVHDSYIVALDHVLPPWATEYIRVEGEFEYLSDDWGRNQSGGMFPTTVNESYYGKMDLKLPYVMGIPIERLLGVGDRIHIDGTVPSGKSNPIINISLLYEALETYDTAGTIVLHASFNCTHVDVYHQHFNMSAPPSLQNQSYDLKPEFKNGADFHLDIRILPENKIELILKNHLNLIQKTDLAPWAIEFIRIDGDLLLRDLPTITYKKKTTDEW